ncbi:MAG TPA: type VI secretion system baseplate subunit TssG [Longimicrobiales bacterium]|nr:type VI secretion system baseplate subunit TssG [Longimicrobiales bacterium]
MNREAVGKDLRENPRAFSFFQAVRVLEAVHPDRSPVGGPGDPGDEVVRFSSHPSLAFPASEIEDLEPGTDGSPPVMSVNFLGLVGPQGVLPLEYTRLVAERVQARDTTLRAFLDVFQHRAVSLFYRAWRKFRFMEQRERGEEDVVTTHLHDLAGLGLPAQRRLAGLETEALVGYAGLLAAQPRSAQALKQLLEDYFQVPVEVEQFIGGWYTLRTSDQCEIGNEDRRSSRLGLGAVSGDEVWDPQSRARVTLGPLDLTRYRSFLPGQPACDALAAVLRFFSHGEHQFEVRLVLDADEVPGLHLDTADSERLGWTTWLRTRRPTRDADQTIFRIDEGDPS